MSEHDYASFKELPASAQLQELGLLIEQLESAKQRAAEAEEKFKSLQQVVTALEQYVIPEQMLAMNCKRHETVSGLVVELKETLRCSVPEANKERAMAWLVDHGHGAVIKDTVLVMFNAKEHESAIELAKKLQEAKLPVKQEQRVESATLRSLLRKLLEQGEDVPMELFGAFQQTTAVVSTKKPKEAF